ncbi:MAG: HAD-IIA family hydrolase [Bacteroidetes bacterium]|jgi:4-nitrophenyl phosphatase|nr:HAD-IIA family hydrolase [Bacteroidota bacterium]
MKFKKIKTLLLDGDGVLWQGEQALPGFLEFFDVLKVNKIEWALLTNNNTRTVDAYIEKLNKFGVSAMKEQIYTSTTVTVSYIKRKYGNKARIHVVGMPDLIKTLSREEFQLTHGEQLPTQPPEAVVAGMDRALNHEKVKIAMRLIMGGAEFIATNTDGSFPTPEGINPGTGMVIGALQATSNTAPTVIGKPQPAIFKKALLNLKSSIESTAMVGDRLETDILGAKRLGIQTLLVLSGVCDKEMLTNSTIKPDHIFESIQEITEMIREQHL